MFLDKKIKGTNISSEELDNIDKKLKRKKDIVVSLGVYHTIGLIASSNGEVDSRSKEQKKEYAQGRIRDICNSGATILRVNGSHLKNETLDLTVENVSKAVEKFNKENKDKKVGFLYDTQGPEIRVNLFNNKPVCISEGDELLIVNDKYSGLEDKKIKVNYDNFFEDVDVIKGKKLTIQSGDIEATVEEVDKVNKICKLKIDKINHTLSPEEQDFFAKNNKNSSSTNYNGKGYVLTDKRHINLYGAKVSQDVLTDFDKKSIKEFVKKGATFIAVSFVTSKADIRAVRNIVKEACKEYVQDNRSKLDSTKSKDDLINEMCSKVKIIAKFETKQGIQNCESIMKEADGAMIARGDLACEIPSNKVAKAGYKIEKICEKKGKMCIFATDVLKSIVETGTPSRNDLNVIFNEAKNGATAFMLSDESCKDSKGDISKQCIETYKNNFNLIDRGLKKQKIKILLSILNKNLTLSQCEMNKFELKFRINNYNKKNVEAIIKKINELLCYKPLEIDIKTLSVVIKPLVFINALDLYSGKIHKRDNLIDKDQITNEDWAVVTSFVRRSLRNGISLYKCIMNSAQNSNKYNEKLKKIFDESKRTFEEEKQRKLDKKEKESIKFNFKTKKKGNFKWAQNYKKNKKNIMSKKSLISKTIKKNTIQCP